MKMRKPGSCWEMMGRVSARPSVGSCSQQDIHRTGVSQPHMAARAWLTASATLLTPAQVRGERDGAQPALQAAYTADLSACSNGCSPATQTGAAQAAVRPHSRPPARPADRAAGLQGCRPGPPAALAGWRQGCWSAGAPAVQGGAGRWTCGCLEHREGRLLRSAVFTLSPSPACAACARLCGKAQSLLASRSAHQLCQGAGFQAAQSGQQRLQLLGVDACQQADLRQASQGK